MSVNTARLLALGLGGLLEEPEKARLGHAFRSAAQADFYDSARITLEAFRSFALRLADAVEAANPYPPLYGQKTGLLGNPTALTARNICAIIAA